MSDPHLYSGPCELINRFNIRDSRDEGRAHENGATAGNNLGAQPSILPEACASDRPRQPLLAARHRPSLQTAAVLFPGPVAVRIATPGIIRLLFTPGDALAGMEGGKLSSTADY